MQVGFREFLDELEETVGFVELLDLLIETEVLEQRAGLGREGVNVMKQILAEAFRVVEELRTGSDEPRQYLPSVGAIRRYLRIHLDLELPVVEPFSLRSPGMAVAPADVGQVPTECIAPATRRNTSQRCVTRVVRARFSSFRRYASSLGIVPQ